jgi:RNA recognition motif-containing protein
VYIVTFSSRGYGFIEFNSPADQQRVLSEKADLIINNRQVKILLFFVSFV